MKNLQSFSMFEKKQSAISNILKKVITNYTRNRVLDLEEETSLLAICKKLNIKPTSIYINKQVPNFSIKESKEMSLSKRTKNFINKVICDYLHISDVKLDKIKIEELLSNLGLNYNEIVDKCYTK